MKRVLFLTVLFLLAGLSLADYCPPGVNLEDRNSNSFPDYACIGDWDNDGNLTIEEDVQAAINQLTDQGPKLAELSEGTFLPPVVASNSYGILQLPSNITLQGQGQWSSTLQGFPGTDITSPMPVISNSDYLDGGNENITIRFIEVNGGWDGLNGEFPHHRVGISFSKCTNCRVENSKVRDTLHACLYAKNGANTFFEDNQLERCGNYTGSGNRFPCLYVYASYGNTNEDMFLRRNTCDESGGGGLSTRRDSPDSFLHNLVYEDNVTTNPRRINGYAPQCFNLIGIDGAQYLDNTCINTGGIRSMSGMSGYYADGLEVSSATNLLIDGLEITPVKDAGVLILNFLENATFRNVTVHGSDLAINCVSFWNPVRNVVLEDSTLLNCGLHGLMEFPGSLSGTSPEEGLTLRGCTVDGAAASGVMLYDTRNNLRILGSSFRNLGARGITNQNGASFSNLEITGNLFDGINYEAINLNLEGSATSSTVVVAGNTIRNFGVSSPASNKRGINITGLYDQLEVGFNSVEDYNGAEYGIYHDVTGIADESYVCTNTCAGNLNTANCLYVSGDVAYQTDDDIDGTVNACDRCPLDPNYGWVTDSDGDFEGDLCDLDDGMIFLTIPDSAMVRWQQEQGYDSWNLYRGDLAVVRDTGVYTQLPGSNSLAECFCGLSSLSLADAITPQPGQISFYLVTGESAGTEDSLGHERPNENPCL